MTATQSLVVSKQVSVSEVLLEARPSSPRDDQRAAPVKSNETMTPYRDLQRYADGHKFAVHQDESRRSPSPAMRPLPRVPERSLATTRLPSRARASSPTPSSTSSAFSAATTTATMSSRSSLSSCRSLNSFMSTRRESCSSLRVPDTRSFSRASRSRDSTRDDCFSFPKPMSVRDSISRRRRRYGSRDHDCSSSSSSSNGGGTSFHSRDIHRRREQYSRRRSDKDYASEASNCGSTSSTKRVRSRSSSRSRSSGRSVNVYAGSKRCRSGSRDREWCSRGATGSRRGGGRECTRCLEWCRSSRDRKITRTLPIEYWIRTPACKAAKSRHMDYMDNMTYSREQFIEETVFTCPFTGAQRDIVLERNMFPYDVPTDVEHWTLWSRNDLDDSEMEAFVQNWADKNHPHVVEWECDNNEGDRSIDWFHVHVFFRLGCEDRTGVPRDASSAYTGPCRTSSSCTCSASSGAPDKMDDVVVDER